MGEIARPVKTNEEIVSEFVERCFDDDYGELVDEFVADDFVGYAAGAPEPIHGREGMRETLEMFRSGFAGLSSEVADVCADGGDTVAVRWVLRGTHEGEFMGVAPSGNDIEVDGMEFNRLSDGKIVETHIVWDTLGMLEQIGGMPGQQAA